MFYDSLLGKSGTLLLAACLRNRDEQVLHPTIPLTWIEVTGYGCNDHFKENDTVLHAWESIAQILVHSDARDM
jgi:hypothetical protein